jgi:hypothetical protein
VWSFGFDINHDGREDIFVSDSTENSNNGKIGKTWILFINNGDGTFSVGMTDVKISIAPSALGYTVMGQDSSKSLITYIPESADSGNLVWYNYVNGKIVNYSKKIEPSGKDEALYNKYLHNGLDHESNRLISIYDVLVSNIQ